MDKIKLDNDEMSEGLNDSMSRPGPPQFGVGSLVTKAFRDQHRGQALLDLTNRSRSGACIYLVIFALIAAHYQMPDIHPNFFAANMLCLSVIMASRTAQIFALEQGYISNQALAAMRWFIANMMLTAAHWGVMIGWIYYDPAYQAYSFLLSLVTPGLALGGACVLSISVKARYAFAVLMLMPVFIVCTLLSPQVNLGVSVGIVLALVYIIVSSKAPHDDYWNAVVNKELAEKRADIMTELSVKDQLTKIHNRLHFDSELAREWGRAKSEGSLLSLLLIDIDYFKKLNDQYGHLFGDHCLQLVARSIDQQARRSSDAVCESTVEILESKQSTANQHVARYGGEEFVVLLPNTDEGGAQVVAERIRKAIEAISLDCDGKDVRITTSIGGATMVPGDEVNAQMLVKRADEALYEAKNGGRNRYAA